jgi:DNA-binding transcriptional MerR regulator
MATEGMRLDDLARAAGVATTTLRLYRGRGLLPPPRLEGRTGYYDDGHLARLALIARLQDQGFSLAGIGRLLAAWQEGRGLADLVGVEHELGALLGGAAEVVLTAAELAERLPPDALTPEVVARAADLGLVEPTADGRFRVPDRRFLDTGAALVALGVPVAVVLDEWAHLRRVTDGVARRFVAVFEDHLVPADLDAADAGELATTLARLRQAAGQVVAAALDASIARVGARRLEHLVPGAGG